MRSCLLSILQPLSCARGRAEKNTFEPLIVELCVYCQMCISTARTSLFGDFETRVLPMEEGLSGEGIMKSFPAC